jgi:hypothetical protein
LDRARRALPTVGLSGSDRLLALVVTNGGGRVINGGNAMLDPLLEPPKPSCPTVELKLMLDFLRLLCLSNVFCAENGLGRRMYLKRTNGDQRNSVSFPCVYICFLFVGEEVNCRLLFVLQKRNLGLMSL